MIPAMALPRVCLISPAAQDAHNGNAHTAARWQVALSPFAQVRLQKLWDGAEADVMIALHARRSADSIDRFHRERPRQALVVVLTGTDLYRDHAAGNEEVRHSLECASAIVVLQPLALRSLPPAWRAKACVIEQSATLVAHDAAAPPPTVFCAVGHLRDEKDPATLMAAARRLAARRDLLIVHIGAALDEALAREAEATARACPAYRWLGALPPEDCRRWMARSHALVHMSRMEGGANAVIEAIRSGTALLASRIDGNLGLLGEDFEGVFPVGDAAALAALMQRFADDEGLAQRLRLRSETLSPQFAPEREAAKVQALLADALQGFASLRQSAP